MGLCLQGVAQGGVLLMPRVRTMRMVYLCMILGGLLYGSVVLARSFESNTDHLLQLGVKMFPTLVGGNLDLESQKSDSGNLLLLVLFHDNRSAAEGVVNRLQASVRVILKYGIDVQAVDARNVSLFQPQPVAGIFLAESMAPALRASVQEFGNIKKSIVFSPFEGEVQQGILSGLSIATQVKPALNLVTLRASGIRMNPLFFKVAKTYE